MKALAMDFLAVSRPGRWGSVVLLAGVAVAAATGAGYWHLLQQRSLLEDRMGQLVARSADANGARAAKAKPDDRTRAMNVVAERISVPWEKLFQDIEACDTPEVALLQLQPNITLHQVSLTGEARDRNAVEHYMKRLEETASLEGVHLAQHSQAPESGPWAIRYALTAKWTYEQR